MPLPRKRALLYRRLGVALAVVLVLLFFWSPWSAQKPSANLQTVAVTRANLEETVTAQGAIEPKEFVDVGAQVSGQLQKLHVDIGDPVKKGQLIAEIDPKIYTATVQADEAKLKTLRAQLAEQQATADFTKSVYARNAKLIKADGVSKETLDSSQKEWKAAQARVNSYGAQIEEAQSKLQADKANLGYTKIYAPMTGTVVSQTSKEGQTLNANQTAPVIVQVANLDTMTVRAQVAEADVSRLKPGMDVYFTTLGSERRWTSTLRQLLPSPDAKVTDVVLYNALVDVENTDHALMTGMSTQMFFLLGKAENALVIPAQALGKKLPAQEGAAGERYEVAVKDGKGTKTQEVTIGLLNRNQAEVLGGLNEGDHVVLTTSKTSDEKKPAAAGARMPRM